MEHTDALLKELGRGLPFEVDWAEYHREVLRRIARSEAARRRRSVWLMLAGAVSGAAAMLLLTQSFAPVAQPRPAEVVSHAGTIEPEQESRTLGYVRTVRSGPSSTGVIRANIESARASDQHPETAKPFLRRNGGSEIRFDGYSAPGAPEAGFIVAGQTRR